MPLNEFTDALTKLSTGLIKWTDKAILDTILEHQFETANIALQAALPNNYLIPDFDEEGKPIYNGYYSVMVRIPKFKIGDVIESGGEETHPAFIVNGKELDSIYISKYQNVVVNTKAYSFPMKDPTVGVNFDQAYNYCKAKGKGWHLMTNAEWAAIALWCKKNGTMPKGNNNYGKDIADGALPQKAVPSYIDTSDSKILRTATGSGPLSWYHDGTEAGIADLNGNVWEWISGMRLKNGEINIIKDNDAVDTSNSTDVGSPSWEAITSNGSLVDPGTEGACKYTTAYSDTNFSTITTEPAATGSGATLLESLCLLPHMGAQSSDYGEDAVWVNLEDERVLLRGGSFYHGASSGVFALTLNDARAYSDITFGFRAAYFDEAD